MDCTVSNSDLPVAFAVPYGYCVHFTEGLFAPGNPLLAQFLGDAAARPPARCLVALDAGLVEAWPRLADAVGAYARAHADALRLTRPPVVLAGGEAAKNSFEVAYRVIRLAREDHLCRQSFIVAAGGGAFLDAVGFAAALVHRGMRLVRVPTTVLAQNDSGVGVKNGLNLRGVKNFIGTFAPPAAVFNDSDFLRTLPRRDWVAGAAEAFKVGIIRDAAFLAWLCDGAQALGQGDEALMRRLVRRCARLHVEHIQSGGDPFESGSARPLDFGHWAGHKIESLSCNELRHGEAVAIGMAIDLLYAAGLGYITSEAAEGVIAAMVSVGLPVWHDCLDAADPAGRRLILNGLEEFREHLGGVLHVTYPRPLGRGVEVTAVDDAGVVAAIERLRRLAGRAATLRE
ncbi:MAG: 3-dehydroquinate synthase [Lentisphaerae bacterium ADurb.BinA184]|nr:MAG: 3-dehydroquinate synthase [Lentisphaerae bacterium ADurb.BinA184]